MIISFSSHYRYFLYGGNTDMRKGYDGLCGVVRAQFKLNPLSGDVFIFLNRYRNRIKLLHWQGDGFAVYSKRLEKGTFEQIDRVHNLQHTEVSSLDLQLIMSGINLKSVKKRIRYGQIIVNKKVA